jgi:hypothetical protein
MPLKTKLTINLEKPTYGTVLKETQTLLTQNPEYQEAIKFIGKNKNISEYRSLIDFLFCEVFTEWKRKCFKFYDGEEHKLKDDPKITEIQITKYDNYLTFIVLPTALATYQENIKMSWSYFRTTLSVVEKVLKLDYTEK